MICVAYRIEDNYAHQHDKVSADSCTIQQHQEWYIKSNREQQNSKVKACVHIVQQDWFRAANSQRQKARMLDRSHIFLQEWFRENSSKHQLELWDKGKNPIQLHDTKKLKERGMRVNDSDDTHRI